MALDPEAIEDAIFALMEADAPLLAVLGGTLGRLYPEQAPEDPTSPYVVYTQIVGVTDPTFTSDGEILQYQFSVFNKAIEEPLNRDTINEVIKKLTDAYDDSEDTMTIAGHTVVSVDRGTYGNLATLENVQGWRTDYQITIQDD